MLSIHDAKKHKRPLKLIYYEACLDEEDLGKREKHLKTHYGKMFLKKKLKSCFTGVSPVKWFSIES